MLAGGELKNGIVGQYVHSDFLPIDFIFRPRDFVKSFALGFAIGSSVVWGMFGSGCSRDTTLGGNQPPPSQVSSTVLAASSNLGAKISRRLIREPNLKEANIVVGVSNLDGTVYLSGTVVSLSQKELALKLARVEAAKAQVVSQLQVRKRKSLIKKKMLPPKRGEH